MNKELQNYLSKKFIERVNKIVNTKYNVEKKLDKMLTYPVPKLGPNGSCSTTRELEAKLYDLREVFKYNHIEGNYFLDLVYRLNKIVEFLALEINADWIGIYKKLDTKSGQALVKLAYRGRPSRAEFPLTKKFASHSNNSTVGLAGKPILVQSVSKHIEAGYQYYECDGRVESEFCLPVFDRNKNVIGIIDIESFKENFFSKEKIIKAELVAVSLSIIL